MKSRKDVHKAYCDYMVRKAEQKTERVRETWLYKTRLNYAK